MRHPTLLLSLVFAFCSGCFGWCAQTCPSGGCPSGETCHGTIDTGSYCCGAPGAACSADASFCCTGCTDAGTCACLPTLEHATCRTHQDCCSGRCGADAGWATCVGQAPGSACSVGSDCMTGECDAGTCRCRAGTSGGDCLVDSDCCFGGCSKIGSPFGHCCYPGGMTCFGNSDCCSGTCAGADAGAGTCM